VGLILCRTHELLGYADDARLFGGNIDILKSNAETVIDASKEVVTEVNSEKTKCML
jgi:hypothetical protein